MKSLDYIELLNRLCKANNVEMLRNKCRITFKRKTVLLYDEGFTIDQKKRAVRPVLHDKENLYRYLVSKKGLTHQEQAKRILSFLKNKEFFWEFVHYNDPIVAYYYYEGYLVDCNKALIFSSLHELQLKLDLLGI